MTWSWTHCGISWTVQVVTMSREGLIGSLCEWDQYWEMGRPFYFVSPTGPLLGVSLPVWLDHRPQWHRPYPQTVHRWEGGTNRKTHSSQNLHKGEITPDMKWYWLCAQVSSSFLSLWACSTDLLHWREAGQRPWNESRIVTELKFVFEYPIL